jgi:hypothetical protein
MVDLLAEVKGLQEVAIAVLQKVAIMILEKGAITSP